MSDKTKSLDALYIANKDIEQRIESLKKDERITKIAKNNGLKLEDILKVKGSIENSIGDYLNIVINHSSKDYNKNILDVINSLSEIKKFSKSEYKDIYSELEYDKDNEIYIVSIKNEKEILSKFYITKPTTIYSGRPDLARLNLLIFRNFAEKDSFASELFSIISKDVVIPSIENAFRNKMLLEGENIEENQSTGDMLKSLGVEEYKSGISMDSIGGYKDIKNRIEREVFTPFMHLDVLKEIRKATRITDKTETNSALFYGGPGTGKTLMASVVSNENNLNFLYMNLSQIYSHWYGDSSKRMETAFELVKKYSEENGKTVLFIDEIDSLGSREYSYSNESNKVLNVLLTKLSGVKSEENENLLLIGCTNLIDRLDPALVSRFKSKIYFRKPNKEDRAGIISNYCMKLDKKAINELAEKTDELTGRDIESIASITEENLAYDIANKKKSYNTPKLEDYLNAISLFKQHVQEEKIKNSGMYS